MRATVDATKCSAYGTCSEICPSVFQLDEWGYAAVVDDGSVPAEEVESARAAVAECPEQALALLDD